MQLATSPPSSDGQNNCARRFMTGVQLRHKQEDKNYQSRELLYCHSLSAIIVLLFHYTSIEARYFSPVLPTEYIEDPLLSSPASRHPSTSDPPGTFARVI
ncbi:hypothetical protein M378DRAFT_1002204 [Amanita muscaria Koide BX008]|uniref:Uncharacterized protein n=1 Tax=Amanita muscaria (strain Koide BX008) TaxID=946122 RepID=A0A0C2WS06_AMAMK|nr:hypothetical protein M378DRAFT_1002204 [Amanita muscaria Koide BX008]